MRTPLRGNGPRQVAVPTANAITKPKRVKRTLLMAAFGVMMRLEMGVVKYEVRIGTASYCCATKRYGCI